MRRFVFVLILLCLPSFAAAQTPVTPGDRLGWDQPAASVIEAQSYTYLIAIDGGAPTAVTGATCTGTTSPFVCSVPFPAMTPGVDHSVTVAARKTVNNVNLDSPFSAPAVFRLEVVPGTPVNIRRVSGSGDDD